MNSNNQRSLGMVNLEGRNIISMKDLNREEIECIFNVAKKMEPIAIKRGKSSLLQDKICASLFFQPSTRTRLSFESAMQRLGGSVLGFASIEESRAGGWTAESMPDTARMINGYADVAVIRHFVTGAAADYASASTIPVINGGDGSNEHPSQALLDLYTIKKEKGRIDGLNVLVVGKSTRATLSLCFGLAKFNDININFMCPDNVRIAESNIKYIRDSGASFKEVSKIADVLKETDVIYIINVWPYDKTGTGLKKGDAPEEYILGLDKLQGAKEDLIILHPLPRLDELPKEIDSTPYARYFEQATNGLYIRMALLALVLGKRP